MSLQVGDAVVLGTRGLVDNGGVAGGSAVAVAAVALGGLADVGARFGGRDHVLLAWVGHGTHHRHADARRGVLPSAQLLLARQRALRVAALLSCVGLPTRGRPCRPRSAAASDFRRGGRACGPDHLVVVFGLMGRVDVGRGGGGRGRRPLGGHHLGLALHVGRGLRDARAWSAWGEGAAGGRHDSLLLHCWGLILVAAVAVLLVVLFFGR